MSKVNANFIEKIKSHSFVFCLLLIFVSGFEIFFHSVYFPIKGDIFDLNFDTVGLLGNLERDGWGEFLKNIFVTRPNKGTHLLLFNLPFFAGGVDHTLVNRFWIFTFNLILYASLYRIFLFRSSPWVSAIGALVMVSCELIFTSINEYDTYMFFLCSLPAVAIFAERMHLRIGSWRLNSVGLIVFMFICIGARPFESFFVALATVIVVPVILRFWVVWMGFFVGGGWWALNFGKVSQYWKGTQDLLAQPQHNFTFIRVYNETTMIVLCLVVSAILLFFKRKQAIPRVTKVAALASPLLLLVQLMFGMVEDDYLQFPLFLMMFAALNTINQLEHPLKIKWRAAILAGVALVFFVDQGIAVVQGYSPLEISRQVPRLDRLHAKDWKDMSQFFPKNSEVSIAMLYNHRHQAGDYLRPIRSTFQTLAYRDGYKVQFTNVSEYKPIESPIGLKGVCAEGHSYALVMRYEQAPEDPKSDRENFRYLKHTLEPGFLEQLPAPTFSFSASSDFGLLIVPVTLQLVKLPCE